MTNEFCLSSDNKLLAVVSESPDGDKQESHLWDLDSGAHTRVVLDLPPDCQCTYLAVGHLYQLLEHEVRRGRSCDIYLQVTGSNQLVKLLVGCTETDYVT